MNLPFHPWNVWQFGGFCINPNSIIFGRRVEGGYESTLSPNLETVGIFCTVVIWPPRAVGCQPESRLGTAHFCLVLICAFLSTCILHFNEYYCQSTKLPRRCTFLSTCILCILMQTQRAVSQMHIFVESLDFFGHILDLNVFWKS